MVSLIYVLLFLLLLQEHVCSCFSMVSVLIAFLEQCVVLYVWLIYSGWFNGWLMRQVWQLWVATAG